jgi:hypothetical protein
MSHPLSSTKAPSPHPVLQAVLSSLDVELEVELALYRCHQAVRRLPPLARQANQGQISKTFNETLLENTELAATTQLPESTHSNLDHSVSNSDSSDSDSTLTSSSLRDVSLLELTGSPLTLADYLEFSQAQLKKLEIKASAKSRFSPILKPLVIAAVSLLLSIPLSYLMINLVVNSMSLNGIGLETCPATEASRHFCNSSSLGNR